MELPLEPDPLQSCGVYIFITCQSPGSVLIGLHTKGVFMAARGVAKNAEYLAYHCIPSRSRQKGRNASILSWLPYTHQSQVSLAPF
jgi:hypothetical protein